MMRLKWQKWKIGAIGALGIVFLFNQVKASPAFEKTVRNSTDEQNSAYHDPGESEDQVLQDWLNQNDGDTGGNDNSLPSQNQTYDYPGGQSGSQSIPFHTRTRRS